MNNISHLFTNREYYGSDPTGDVQRVAEAGSITQAAAKVHRVPSNSLPVYASWKQNWGLICLFAKSAFTSLACRA